MLTFGNVPSAVDWLWIGFLTDPSISKVPEGTHPSTYYDLDLATTLDPAYSDAYIAGGNILAVVRGDGVGARDLLKKGDAFRKSDFEHYPELFRQSYWSRSWAIPILIAYIDLFQLNDMPNAALAFREAAEIPGAPDYVVHLSQRFDKPDGQYEVGLRLLNFLISGATDRRVAERLQKQRDSLFVAQYLFNLNFSFRDFLKKIPRYYANSSVSAGQMEQYWLKFLKKTGTTATDPWGGKLKLDASGRVVTSTPYQTVFGLN